MRTGEMKTTLQLDPIVIEVDDRTLAYLSRKYGSLALAVECITKEWTTRIEDEVREVVARDALPPSG